MRRRTRPGAPTPHVPTPARRRLGWTLGLGVTVLSIAALVLSACGNTGGSTSGTTAPHRARDVGLHRVPLGSRRQQGRNLPTPAPDTPTAIAGIPGRVVQIATSNSDGYARTSTGAVYGWGVNSYGELGDGQLTPYETKAFKVDSRPVSRSPSLANPMPFDGALAIDSTGHAWGWGLNAADDLCLSGLVEKRPQQLPLSDVTLATGARTHALVDAHGTVYSCGSGDAGELGNGSTASASTPTPVVGLPSGVGVTALTSSWEGSGALLSNGDYYNWGYNAAGQLGNGSTTNSAVPVKVDTSRPRHPGIPRRERGQERPDDRHPAKPCCLDMGQQRSRPARHRQPDGLRCPGAGARPQERRLRQREFGRLCDLRHRSDRTALGLGRQPERPARHGFSHGTRDAPGQGRHRISPRCRRRHRTSLVSEHAAEPKTAAG